MTHSLPPPPDSQWVVLDWGVVRTLGERLSPPHEHVTVIPDVFAREAATASGDYPGIRVTNKFLRRLPAPFHVAVAREWHEFSVDDSSPPPPLTPRDICNESATTNIRGSLLAGRDPLLAGSIDTSGSDAKLNWPPFIVELASATSQDPALRDDLIRRTRHILDDPFPLLELFTTALPNQINTQWARSISSNPRGYPKFLFFAAMVFYAVHIHAKNRTNAKSIENDFDDLHYAVSAGITGHICTAEKSAGLGVPHLPDAIAHLYGDKVRVWTPDEWCTFR
nr:hypothetical protein [Nitrosomonas nitrosa]